MYASLVGKANLCGLQVLENFTDQEGYDYLVSNLGKPYVSINYTKVDSLDSLPFRSRGPIGGVALNTGQCITALIANSQTKETHPKSAAVEAIIREKYKILHESEWLLNHNSGNLFKTIIFEVKAQDGNS